LQGGSANGIRARGVPDPCPYGGGTCGDSRVLTCRTSADGACLDEQPRRLYPFFIIAVNGAYVVIVSSGQQLDWPVDLSGVAWFVA